MTPLRLVAGIVFALSLPFAASPLAAQTSDSVLSPPLMIPAAIVLDSSDAAVTPLKAEAALAMAIDLSGKFSYMPSDFRDSNLRLQHGVDQTSVSALDAARLLKAEYLVFASCRRVANLVRSEIVIRGVADTNLRLRGAGFACIRYARDSAVVADPALLTSMQRALTVALRSDSLYLAPSEQISNALRVRPTRLLSVGGFTMRNDSALSPPWTFFDKPTVTSYHVALSTVYALQSHPTLTMVDLDTRDSMYAKAGFYLVENDRQVTPTELRILVAFGIDQIILGDVQRIPAGAQVSVSLATIHGDGTLSVERSATRTITVDSVSAVTEAITKAVYEVTQFKPEAQD